jgi:hypothetical protein
VLSPARPGYGQEANISIRGFRYAMLAQPREEKGEGPPAGVVNITRRALAGLRGLWDAAKAKPCENRRAMEARRVCPAPCLFGATPRSAPT